jgi:dihydroorotate dehydrogenase (fumarate)
LTTVGAVKRALQIPVAAKLAPFLTSFAHFSIALDRTGVDGLVLFNRYYDADIDPVELEVRRSVHLSTSAELSMRLRGVAAIGPFVRASLAVSGGVHTGLDVVKSTMVGAHVTQLVSALLRNGPGHLATVRQELEDWMSENEWESLTEMRGNMSVSKIPNPYEYMRANYMRLMETLPELESTPSGS